MIWSCNMDRRKKNYRFIAAVVFLMLLTVTLCGCTTEPENEVHSSGLTAPLMQPEEANYSTYVVTSGKIEQWVSGYGSFYSLDNRNIFLTKTTGRVIKEIHVSFADSVTAGQLLIEFDTAEIEAKIKSYETTLRQQELKYLKAKNNGSNQNDIDLAYLNYQQAQLTMQSYKDQLEESALYAPCDGKITFMRDMKIGDKINSYTTIFSISDPRNLYITFEPSDLDYFAVGMDAAVKINNSDQVYTCKVVQTPADVPEAGTETEKKSVLLVASQSLSQEDADALLESAYIGATIHVSCLVQSEENAIVIPSKYVKTYSSRKYVRVLTDGEPVERDVTIGIKAANSSQITSGLSDGEILVIN